MHIFWIFVGSITPFFVSVVMFEKKGKKMYSVIILSISLLMILIIIADLSFLLIGPSQVTTNLKSIDAQFGSRRSGYYETSVKLTAHDGHKYFVTSLRLLRKPPNGEEYEDVRITYLPITKTVIKIEQHPEEYEKIIWCMPHKSDPYSADGYREIYEYKKDSLNGDLFVIMIFVVIGFVIWIQIKRGSY